MRRPLLASLTLAALMLMLAAAPATGHRLPIPSAKQAAQRDTQAWATAYANAGDQINSIAVRCQRLSAHRVQCDERMILTGVPTDENGGQIEGADPKQFDCRSGVVISFRSRYKRKIRLRLIPDSTWCQPVGGPQGSPPEDPTWVPGQPDP